MFPSVCFHTAGLLAGFAGRKVKTTAIPRRLGAWLRTTCRFHHIHLYIYDLGCGAIYRAEDEVEQINVFTALSIHKSIFEMWLIAKNKKDENPENMHVP
ncbi:MAG: hypothetical protein AB2705_12245 [Candidatus Thiodiazotropha sp.]